MAPEILEEKAYTSKADIWSIGVVFYQLLFGEPPYRGTDCKETLKSIKSKPILDFSKKELSVLVLDFLKKTLVINPD